MNKSSNKIGYWQLKDKHVIVFVYPHSNSKSVCIGSCMRGFLTVGSMGGGGRERVVYFVLQFPYQINMYTESNNVECYNVRKHHQLKYILVIFV